jgi:tetratricopeptide (TPR) repeat protein
MKMPSENAVVKIVKLDGMEALQLEPEEVFVVSRVNGTSTLKEIGQILGYDVGRVWKLLSRSIEAGILEIQVPTGEAKAKADIKAAQQSILQQLDEEDKDPVLSKIPRGRRSEILLRYKALASQNYYDILGVPSPSPVVKVRESYFQLAKTYHPDKFFGKDIGHYRSKLEEVFGGITKAYEDLNDPKKKELYDNKLRAQYRAKSAADPKPKSRPLTGKTLIERIALGKKYYDMGRREEDAGNGLGAVNFYRMALQYEPNNETYARAVDRAAPFVYRKRADDAFKKAVECLEYGDHDGAIELMEAALALAPKKRECLKELPLLYLKQRVKLTRARELAELAILHLKSDAELHVTLGRIYSELGMNEEARQQYKMAVGLDKNCEGAQAGLKALKGK